MRAIDREVDQAYWAVEDARDGAQQWFLLGQTLLRRSRASNVTLYPLDEPAARLALCVASNLEPTDAETCFELGRLLEECGEATVATQAFVRAAELEPVWTDPCASVARLLLDRSQQHLGEAWARRGLERAEQYGASPSLLTELAQVFGRLGQWSKAVEILRLAYGPEPEEAPSLINLAIASRLAGDLKAAVEFARRATTLEPASPAAFVNLARCLETAGELDEASATYQTALSLDPGQVRAQEGLTRIKTVKSAPGAYRAFVASTAEISSDTEGYIRGDLKAFAVPELLEVVRFHRRTGRLILASPRARVIVGFREGRLVDGCNESGRVLHTDDAGGGVSRGELAASPDEARAFFTGLLRSVLKWKTGQFEFRRTRCHIAPSNLAQDSQHLLMLIYNSNARPPPERAGPGEPETE